jgi:hypothetical protein
MRLTPTVPVRTAGSLPVSIMRHSHLLHMLLHRTLKRRRLMPSSLIPNRRRHLILMEIRNSPSLCLRPRQWKRLNRPLLPSSPTALRPPLSPVLSPTRATGPPRPLLSRPRHRPLETMARMDTRNNRIRVERGNEDVWWREAKICSRFCLPGDNV